jgi:multiple sugar transport system permease protein
VLLMSEALEITRPVTTQRTGVVVRMAAVRHAALYAGMAVVAFFMLVPFYWMVQTSFSPKMAAFTYPPRWFPPEITIDNYVRMTVVMPFVQFYLNSTTITGSVLLGQLVICSLAGYSFARLHFPFRGQMFAFVLGAMMIPHIVNIIPLYVMFKSVGWINTFYPLIVPAIFTASFGTFLMRQYFMTIPEELEDAARVDGAGTMTIFARIMIPLAKPVLAALAIFTFMGTWNDFFTPLIFINSKSKMTITLGIAALQGEFASEWTVMMAAATASVIPILAVYIVGQKHFIQGITLTGLKG